VSKAAYDQQIGSGLPGGIHELLSDGLLGVGQNPGFRDDPIPSELSRQVCQADVGFVTVFDDVGQL
jgi:hypothetical protein